MIDFGRGAVQAFRYLFRYEYTKYVDLDNLTANFEDGSFVQLINNIKQQLENGYFIPNFNSTEDRKRDFVESQRLYYYKFNTDLVLMDIFSPNRNEAHEKTFPIPDADEIAGLWVNSEGNASLLYYQAYGMNANSPNKELAWEFLNFLIGEEMQQSLTLLGFPVNNAAFIERTKEKFSTETADNGRLKVVGEKNINAYNDYMEYLNGFIDELNFYPVTDKIIHEMVTDEVDLFFEGVKSAESVAGVLQNKVQLYLSENE